MGSNNEMILKVKLVSDNTNPNPSPVTGMGGSSAHGAGASPAMSGGIGGASPLLAADNDHKKIMEAHSARLKGLNDDFSKLAVGLSYLTGSTSGFSKGLEKAANALALVSVAASGISAAKTLFSGGTMKAVGAAMTNPWTYVAAGAASIGYGLYSGKEDGTSYMGGFNQWRANTFGGGKVNSRGQWISQDQQLGNIHHQFNERMRRDEMQHPIDIIKMEGRESKYALMDQMHDVMIQGASYKGYASDAKAAEQEHRKQFDANIASGRNVYESFYGKEIGGLMAQREGHGADLQAQVFATEKAGLMVKKRETEGMGSALQWRLARAHSNYNNAADGRDADMKAKDYKTNTMLDEQKNILRITDDIKKNKLEQLEIDKKMADLTTKALSAKKTDTDSRLANAQSLLISTTQSLEGMKQSFGMMDEGSQIYEKDKADRFKKGGLMALSEEERGSMLNGPLGEDVRRQSIERAENNPAFADMFKGSRMEANLNKASDQVRDFTKLSAEIKTQIDAKVELDPQELAKKLVEAMTPFISKVTVAVDRAVMISTQQAENSARRSAQEKAGNQP